MKIKRFLIAGLSVSTIFSAVFCEENIESNKNILIVNKNSVQNNLGLLAAPKQVIGQVSSDLGMLKQERMRARAKIRAQGAEDRRNKFMEARDKRKKALEERRTILAQKKAEYAKTRKNESSDVPTKKPAAPKNTMLGAQNKQPIILKSPVTQIKKS